MAPNPDFLTTPVLTGELVRLIPATGDHATALWPLLGEPEVARLTGSIHSSDEQISSKWTLDQVSMIYDRWAKDIDREVWVIEDLETGEIVGEAVLHELDRENYSCAFRIWIAKGRGKGMGTEATELAVGHGFEAQHLHRIWLEVYDFNPRARHVYEKVGFTWEGTMRESLRFDDGWIDAHVMSMLKHEWAAR